MGYTTIRVHSEQLAAKLAQRKIEKKWKALGFSPYEETYQEYIGAKYTEEAEADYQKHYHYFLDVISEMALTYEMKIEKQLKEAFNDE